jgi:hypothetical protein
MKMGSVGTEGRQPEEGPGSCDAGRVNRRIAGIEIGHLVLREKGRLVVNIPYTIVFPDFTNTRAGNLVGRLWEGKLSRAVLRGVPANAERFWKRSGQNWCLDIQRGPITPETSPADGTGLDGSTLVDGDQEVVDGAALAREGGEPPEPWSLAAVTPDKRVTPIQVGRVFLQKSGLVVFHWDLEEVNFGDRVWKALEKAHECPCWLSLCFVIPERVTANYSALHGMVGRWMAGVEK